MLDQCSTGTPCASCLKNGNGLHDLKCQRESPFIGKMMHQCRFSFTAFVRKVTDRLQILHIPLLGVLYLLISKFP